MALFDAKGHSTEYLVGKVGSLRRQAAEETNATVRETYSLMIVEVIEELEARNAAHRAERAS